MLPFSVWNSPVFRGRLKDEASFEAVQGLPSKEQYWFVAPQSDAVHAEIILKSYNSGPIDPDPHELQMIFAQELRAMLQKEIGHNGYWLVGFTHPPATWESVRVDGDNVWGRMVMIWADQDGDIQFPFDTELPFAEVLGNGIEYYVNACETCWQQWSEEFGPRALKSDFGISEKQLGKPVLESLN